MVKADQLSNTLTAGADPTRRAILDRTLLREIRHVGISARVGACCAQLEARSPGRT